MRTRTKAQGSRLRKVEVVSCFAGVSQVEPILEAGADALYCGLVRSSWHNTSIELSWDEIYAASKIIHGQEKKLYVAINRDLTTEEVDELLERLPVLDNGMLDGLILSDWGCIHAIRQRSGSFPIHLSANAGCMHDWDFKLAEELGVQRIVLPPAMTLKEMNAITSRYHFEWEAITYGMKCINEAGHCQCELPVGEKSTQFICSHPLGFSGGCMDDEVMYLPFGNQFSRGEEAQYLRDIGVNHWKIEGRARGYSHIAQGTRTLRSLADIPYGGMLP
ncbi:U32 family peptidase [Paenibacillus sp. FSL H7-0756]|uniref:peptidase U32 family protein n=1 Tax=Paenibacillus sp. FSL H7-0756 TaxID=2954738 RepID=UPI0030FAEF92